MLRIGVFKILGIFLIPGFFRIWEFLCCGFGFLKFLEFFRICDVFFVRSDIQPKSHLEVKEIFTFDFCDLLLMFSIFWPILFCIMCTVLIVVPLLTETKDSLIGCAMLICGVIPYFLWGNQKYTPSVIKSFADSIKLCTGENFEKIFKKLFN